MRIEVAFTVPEAKLVPLEGSTVVVVDVVRATTTLIMALSSGAEAIYPAASNEEAVKLLQSLGREETLMVGERKGTRIEGYHLGNSPSEFTPEKVADKRVIMNTSNGTRALIAVEEAGRVVVGGFVNLSAVAREVAGAERVVVVCAGREDRFALDDAVCAGALIQRIGRLVEGELDLGDSARAALALADVHAPSSDFLRSTAAGAALVEIGLADDLAVCARIDSSTIVPEMRDRVVRGVNAGEGR